MNHLTDSTKHIVDAGAAVTIGATVIGWLPTIAAVLAIIWYVIQIFTFWRQRKHRRK